MTSKSLPTQTVASPAAGEKTGDRFQTDQVLTIATGHFVHDTFTAFLAPLLPLIQDKMGIGYAGAGSLTIFVSLPSLLTPFIGYLADRISLRYFVILAPAVTATLMSLIGFAPSYMALALLLLAVGISVAAFHTPAPAMTARVSGRSVGRGMSIFMASGELGRTVGPVVAVAGVAWWGLDGIWRLALAGWLMSAVLYWRLHTVAGRPTAQKTAGLQSMIPQARLVYPVLAWIMLAKGFMAVAITTYLPIYIRDELEASLWLAAWSLTLLEGAGVVGALSTGTLSDRIGRSRMLLILLAVAPFLLLLLLYGPELLAIPLLIGLGLTAISPTPVMLAIVQDQFPDHRAVANGIFMFLNFLLRAFAVWAVGMMADRLGLTQPFTIAALLAFAAIPATRWVPSQPDGSS